MNESEKQKSVNTTMTSLQTMILLSLYSRPKSPSQPLNLDKHHSARGVDGWQRRHFDQPGKLCSETSIIGQ